MEGDNLLSLNLAYWLLQSAAMALTAFFIPRLTITSIFGAVMTVVALSFVNSHLWDAALFFHLPDTLSIQAVLLLLANGLIFWVLVKILPGIEVQGILPALAAPVVFTITSMIIGSLAGDVDWPAFFKSAWDFLQELKGYLQQTAA